MRNPEHKQYSPFTLPPELAERFDQYVQEQGVSRNAAIGSLIETGMLARGQQVLPERAGDIEDYLACQQKQLAMYRKALECVQDADTRARAGVAHQLDALAGTVEENRLLRAENDNLKTECQKLREQLGALGSIDKIKQEREELTMLRLQAAELKSELATKSLEYSEKLETERDKVFSVIEALTKG